jgi:glutamine amidotransferase
VIIVVDYNTGTVGSVLNMLRKVGAKCDVSRDPEVLRRADKLVLPGVGSFDEAMRNLHEFGLYDVLNEQVLQQRKPILGLCLGAQLMTKRSEEGVLPGFGWLDAHLVRFRPEANEQRIRIPHMGWNNVRPENSGGGIFDGVAQPMRFYFVHSYHMVADDPGIEIGSTVYGYRFASALAARNVVSLQFHPEKSHKFGLQVYRNFVEKFTSC